MTRIMPTSVLYVLWWWLEQDSVLANRPTSNNNSNSSDVFKKEWLWKEIATRAEDDNYLSE